MISYSVQEVPIPLVSYPGMASRTQPDGQVRLMTKVAHMYHEQGIRQTDIASTLHISQAKVSRLLKRAAETGIVRTIVAVTRGAHRSGAGARAALRPAGSGGRRRRGRRTGDPGRSRLGRGRYLENTLTGGERLGSPPGARPCWRWSTGCGRSGVPGAETVVQLVGGMGVPAVQTQANRLLGELAELVAPPRGSPRRRCSWGGGRSRRTCWPTR